MATSSNLVGANPNNANDATVGTRPPIIGATVEQAAMEVLRTNRPVVILYDEYRSRPLLPADAADPMVRKG